MRNRIPIEKDLIPYSFEILLGDELFTLEINHNEIADLFTVALWKDGVLICGGEPFIYGVPLFQDVYMTRKYPSITIVPYDESGIENRVTKENFGNTVFLCIDDEGGSDE